MSMHACHLSGGIISNYATMLHGCFFPINFQIHHIVTLIIPTPAEHHGWGEIEINSKAYFVTEGKLP